MELTKAVKRRSDLVIEFQLQNLPERGIGHNIPTVKASSYNVIKQREADRRMAVVRSKGTRQAVRAQRRVALLGDGAQWRITNWHQVATAMAKWA